MTEVSTRLVSPDGKAEGPIVISSLVIERLHGKFTYTIPIAPSHGDVVLPAGELFAANEDRLTLLYGNNGTGKTSILRLLFHALSSSPNRNHRDALGRTRFARFEVHLSTGGYVEYIRDADSLEGPYTAVLARSHDDPDPITWRYPGPNIPSDEPYFVQMGEGSPSVFMTSGVTYALSTGENDRVRFLEGLGNLGISPVFLGDSRAIISDMLPGADEATRRVAQRTRRIPDPDELLRRTRDVDVEEALSLVRNYLSQLTLAGTQAGSQRADTVYVNVANTIALHAPKVGRPKKTTLPTLTDRVRAVGERAARFHDYGLLPEFPASSLIDALAKAPQNTGGLLERVLEPYLDGLKQRMDALEPGLQAVASFVDALNAFLHGKQVRFRPGREGVLITDTDTQESLSAAELSSGEKQIVLLFSDIVALQDQASLFIIDEPELSLNPQWQRQLMPALLALTEVSQMQLVVATHSIEIMARYRSRLHYLDG